MPDTRLLRVAWVLLLGVAVAAAETCKEDEYKGHGRCAHEACVCFPGWAGLGCDVYQDGTYGELCKLEGCAMAETCEGQCDGETGASLTNCALAFSGVDCSVCNHGQQGAQGKASSEIGTTFNEDFTECVGNPFLSSFCSLSLARASTRIFLSLSQAHCLSNANSLSSSSAHALCLSLSLSCSLLLSLVFSLASCGVTTFLVWCMYHDAYLYVYVNRCGSPNHYGQCIKLRGGVDEFELYNLC